MKIAAIVKILEILDPEAEIDGSVTYKGGRLKVSLSTSQKVGLVPLEVVDHRFESEFSDPDYLDIRDFREEPGSKRMYFPRYERESISDALQSANHNWEESQSFEFNRDPISVEEAEAAVLKYVDV